MADLELNSIGNGDGNNYLVRDNTKIPLSGSNQISGDLVPATDGTVNLGSSSKQFNIIHSTFVVNHSTDIELGLANTNGGADMALCPKEYYGGFFRIRAYNGTARQTLQGDAGGTLYWSGTVIRPYGDGNTILGTGTYRFGQIYSTNSAISTSDERQKDNIKQIDDKLLQAWGNVNIVQFNFKDALEKKGENARLHTGYIAQNIQQACEEKGVNPNDYGLFCHDSWEEQEEKKDEHGEVIEPYRAKGDLYSLRYEEALVVECAYLRRENNKLKQQMLQYAESLSKLEERLKALEQSSK